VEKSDNRKKVWGLIVFFLVIVIVSLFIGVVSAAEEIVIDTEKVVPGFWTEPARDLPANWQYVHDHQDTSADGWFDTNAYPPERGNGSFWYTISFPDMGECKGIWETSVPYTGKYEVFAWIPSPDSFDPYLDESTPPSDYLPTKRAQYKVFHNDGVATVTIDQTEGGFTSLGVFEFDSTARVELSSNGVEFWRSVAFDAVTFVPVVHDMAVTDVYIMPPATSVGQSTAICVTVTNKGTQKEENVSVKAFVDGAQVGSTQYVSLDPGASDTRTFLWIPSAAKVYSVAGEVGVVSGETDTGDNRKAIEVGVLATTTPATILSEATTWPSDPTVNVPICTVSGCRPQMVSDEAGGAIITWHEYDGGPSTIYAQRVDYSGNVLWQQNGKPICTVSIYNYPTIVGDGSGGAIITWPDRHQGRNIYAQHIDSNGNVLWPQPGVLLSEQGGCLAKIASDGYGGALIVWENLYNDPYAQRVDYNGNVLWQQDGVLISTNGRVLESQIVSDGSGGAIITWPDNQGRNIYAQRVDSNGNTVWQPSVPICTADNWRGYPKILQDSSGGAIIAWRDSRSGEGEDLYAQRVDSNGNVLWTTDGVPICTAEGQQAVSLLISDGSGGAIITWNDCRINESDVYVQRVDSGGNILWQQDGVPICTAEKAQWDPKMVSDDHGGAIIAWEDWRSGTGETLEDADIYAQRVDSNGNVLWQQNGVPICTAEKAQWQPKIVSNDYGGAIITWKDYRNGQNWGIYAQNVNLDGTLGVGGPNLLVDVTKPNYDAGEIADVALILEDANGNPVTGLPEIEYRIDSEPWKQESVKAIEPGVYAFAIQFPTVPGEHTLFVNANVGGRIVSGSDSFFVNYGSEKIPVVLVHEYSQDPSSLSLLKDRLENDGFDVYLVDYSPNIDTTEPNCDAMGDPDNHLGIGWYAEVLKLEIKNIKEDTGADKVDIVGYGMGGLIARQYVEKLNGNVNVRKLILLGTPNHGSEVFDLYPEISVSTEGPGLGQVFTAYKLLAEYIGRVIKSCSEATLIPGVRFPSLGEAGKQMALHHKFLNELNYDNPEKYSGEDKLASGVHYVTVAGKKWFYRLHPDFGLKSNDGFVSVDSVRLDGVSGENHAVFGVSHKGLVEDEEVYAKIKERLQDDPVFEDDTYKQNFSQLQRLPTIYDTIENTTKSHNLTLSFANDSSILLIWDKDDSDLDLVLTTPNGTRVNSSTILDGMNITYHPSDNFTLEGYEIKNPTSGTWMADVIPANVSKTANYTLITTLDTNVTLSALPNKYNYYPGEQINVTANLTYFGVPVVNTSMSTKITRPDGKVENITLNKINESHSGTYNNTNITGWYGIIATANGTLNGTEYVRQTTVSLWVEQLPDLTVKSISFLNNTPLIGANVTINATIENIGEGNATNATIDLYIDSHINGTLIGNETINITSNSSEVVSMDWIAEYGIRKIYVVIPASNPFLEENYTNNMAFRSINVTGPVINLSLTMPVEVNLNDAFAAEALIENSGTELIGANATIILPSGLLTSEPLTITLGNIEGNKTVNWNITANQTGLYEICVNLTSVNSEDCASRRNISVFHILLGDLPTNLTCYQGGNVTIDIPITNFNPNVSYVGLYINTSVRDPSDNFYSSINNISLLRAGETETSEFVWNQTEKQGIYEVNVSLFMGLVLVNNKRTQFEVVREKPDLEITAKWLCWPDNCTICYNVTNIGTGTAPACHNTTLYVDDVAVAHDHVPVELDPGESYTGCFNGYRRWQSEDERWKKNIPSSYFRRSNR
jgi:pimeloyl-ACP methyl ester carboxylesterase